MPFRHWISPGVAWLAFWPLAAGAAESIARKHERPVSGDVTAVSKTEVTVKVRNPREDTLTIPANEIEGISWTGELPDANLARSDEAAGRYQKALEGYEKSLAASKSPNPLARIELEYAIIRATARLALTDPARVDSTIAKLEEFRSKHSDHYRDYDAVDWLGRLYAAKKDFAKARQSFDLLSKAPWKESRLAARVASARVLVAEGKPEEALTAFESIISSPGEGAQSEVLQREALLGKARILVTLKKFDEAKALLDEVVKDPQDKNGEAVNAEAYLRLGDCLREQGKDVDALLAYLHVELLYPAEKGAQAEALFQLVRLWDRVGQKGRAAEARDRLESDEFKNSEWARQLKAPASE